MDNSPALSGAIILFFNTIAINKIMIKQAGFKRRYTCGEHVAGHGRHIATHGRAILSGKERSIEKGDYEEQHGHIECSRLSRFLGFRFQSGILCEAELY